MKKEIERRLTVGTETIDVRGMVADSALSFHGFTDHLNSSIDIVCGGIPAGGQS